MFLDISKSSFNNIKIVRHIQNRSTEDISSSAVSYIWISIELWELEALLFDFETRSIISKILSLLYSTKVSLNKLDSFAKWEFEIKYINESFYKMKDVFLVNQISIILKLINIYIDDW